MLYSILPSLPSICAAGANVYASSPSLSSVGMIDPKHIIIYLLGDSPSVNKFSVYNGTQWTLPTYPSIGYQTPVCYDNVTQMWLAYTNGSTIVLLTYTTESTEYFTNTIPFRCVSKLTLLGTADEYLFFQCDPLIRVYNLATGTL
jgi:hypothetical protein